MERLSSLIFYYLKRSWIRMGTLVIHWTWSLPVGSPPSFTNHQLSYLTFPLIPITWAEAVRNAYKDDGRVISGGHWNSWGPSRNKPWSSSLIALLLFVVEEFPGNSIREVWMNRWVDEGSFNIRKGCAGTIEKIPWKSHREGVSRFTPFIAVFLVMSTG